MKTYKFMVEVYVYAENEKDAIDALHTELDYILECDNELQAISYPANGVESE